MSRLSAVLIVFALALVALGIYDITRGKGDDTAAGGGAVAAGGGVDLSTVTAPLGTVVTSGGATLYRFDKDTAKPPKSNCAGACATTWPPLVATAEAPKVTGVDPALVATVAREDGTQQVTLNGWPLYKFAKDSPGETKGEGVGGTWHAVGPSGKPATAGAGAPAGGGGVDLSAVTAPLGTVVTSSGATLYRFDKDTAKPAKSNCAGACATTWPPLVASGAPKVTGVDPALVGTVAREDGTKQVTLNGWPLYKFAKDSPGETKGEGVGGTWHAVGPSGKPATAGAGAPAGGGGAPAGGTAPNQQAPAPAPAPEPDSGGGSGY